MIDSDLPQEVRFGQRPSADWHNKLLRSARRQSGGPATIINSLGRFDRLTGSTAAAVRMRWGKLDGSLAAGGTATVSLWEKTTGGWGGWEQDSGQNWEDVYAPPVMVSGSLDAGEWVLVAVINGRKVVIAHECPEEAS